MKNLFAALESRGLLAALAERDPGLPGEVEATPRLAWIPLELNLRMVRAAVAAFGEPRAYDVLTDAVFAQFDAPLWRSFVSGAVRLLGRDPGSLGRWIPHAFQLVFRDIGHWSVDREGAEEGRLVVTLDELPGALAGERAWLRSLGVGMELLFRLCETDGTGDLQEVLPAERRAVFAVEWKPAERARGASGRRRVRDDA